MAIRLPPDNDPAFQWTQPIRDAITRVNALTNDATGGIPAAQLAGPVVSVTYAASVTLNATQGSTFRVTATGDAALADITGGTDGQLIWFEVRASGAARVVTIGGVAESVPSGQVRVWPLRYSSADDTWRVVSGGGASLVRTPEQYGAVGNGTANDTAALTAALAALQPGETLWIAPDKIYTHTTSLDVPTTAKGARIVGGGEIRATAEATSAFRNYANHSIIEDVRFTCPTTTQRWDTLEHQKLQLHGDGQVLRRVTVDGSAAAGIFTYGASNFLVDSCTVQNTRADAFHAVKASHHGKFINCSAYNVGDDGFAAVAYGTGSDAGLTHHIDFLGCTVINPVGSTLNKGRLFGCAGAQDVKFESCYGEGSYAAGLIVVCEASYQSFASERVYFRDIEIRRANTLAGPAGSDPRPDHGAVIVSNERAGLTIDTVVMRGIRIRDTDTATASRQLSILESGGLVNNIVFDDISTGGTGPAQLFYTNAAASKYTLTDVKGPTSWGWELLGRAKLAAAAATTGAITIAGRDELMIVVRINGTQGGADVPALRFNGDGAANYWDRHVTSTPGGTTSTLTNVQNAATTMARLSGQSTASVREIVAYVANQPGWQKVGRVMTGVSTGAPATVGTLDVAGTFEWGFTGGQITSVELRTAGGTVLMNPDCGILIFGRDFA